MTENSTCSASILADKLQLKIDHLLCPHVASVYPTSIIGKNPLLIQKPNLENDEIQNRWILKCLKITKDINHLRLIRFKHEIDLLKNFPEPFLPVILFDGFVEEQFLYFIYRENFALSLFQLGHYSDTFSTLSSLRSFAKDLLTIVNALHRNDIFHLDLKPANILYEPNLNRVSLIDLGASVSPLLPEEALPKHYFVGTPRYAAPEHLLQRDVSAACDSYSIGVILRELLTGKECTTFQTIDEARRFFAENPLPRLSIEEILPEFRDEAPPWIPWINHLTMRNWGSRLSAWEALESIP